MPYRNRLFYCNVVVIPDGEDAALRWSMLLSANRDRRNLFSTETGNTT
jgi:hypothetical protein